MPQQMRSSLVVLVLLLGCKADKRAPMRERAAVVPVADAAIAEPPAVRPLLPGRVLQGAAVATMPRDAEIETGSWNTEARVSALQGAWVLPAFGTATMYAIEISGRAVKTWDGTNEKHYELELPSPCSMRWSENGQGGQVWSLTLPRGTPMFGLGDAGIRFGDDAFACGDFEIFVLRGQRCRAWHPLWKTWREAKCGFQRAGGRETFVMQRAPDDLRSPDDETSIVLDVEDDALVTEQLHVQHAIPAASFADARAVVDAYERAAKLPSPRSPVTNMSAPSGLVATMANEGTSALYLDHPVTVVGVVVGTHKVSIGLGESGAIDLRDAPGESGATLPVGSQGPRGPTITCATEDTAIAGERVFVSGRVAWWSMSWGQIARELVLVDCHVTAR